MDPSTAVISRLRTQLTGLPALLENVPRDALDRRVAGKWSVTEHVAHLGRYHEVFIERVHGILTEQEPTFQAYRAEDDPEWPDWQVRSFEDAMQRLHAARDTLLGILKDLSGEQRARRGRHARNGVLPLRGWVELFLAHEWHHLYVITRRARGLT